MGKDGNWNYGNGSNSGGSNGSGSWNPNGSGNWNPNGTGGYGSSSGGSNPQGPRGYGNGSGSWNPNGTGGYGGTSGYGSNPGYGGISGYGSGSGSWNPNGSGGYGGTSGYGNNPGYGSNAGYGGTSGYGSGSGSWNPNGTGGYRGTSGYGSNAGYGGTSGYGSSSGSWNPNGTGGYGGTSGYGSNAGYGGTSGYGSSSGSWNPNGSGGYGGASGYGNGNRYNYGAGQKKKSNVGIIVLVVVMMMLALIAGTVKFLMKAREAEDLYGDNSTTASTTETDTEESTFELTTEEFGELTTEDTTEDPDKIGENDPKKDLLEDPESVDIKGLEADNPATNMVELEETFMYQVMKGIESPLTIYTEGITKDDAAEINKNLDVTFAKGTTYFCFYDNNLEINRFEFNYERNENYYVYKHIIEGEEIPASETRAQELSDAIQTFIDENINVFMGDYEKALAIHDYLVTNAEYGDKYNVIEDEHSAYGTVINHVAVCEGYAMAFELIAMCTGMECKFIVGNAGEDHAWNLVSIDGQWYHVDVTWDDPVLTDMDDDMKNSDYIMHKYFNVSDEILQAEGRTWEADFYPEATSMDKNFYQVNGLMCNSHDEYVMRLYSIFDEGTYDGQVIELAVMDYDAVTYDMNDIIQNSNFYGNCAWRLSGDEYVTGYQVLYMELHPQ